MGSPSRRETESRCAVAGHHPKCLCATAPTRISGSPRRNYSKGRSCDESPEKRRIYLDRGLAGIFHRITRRRSVRVSGSRFRDHHGVPDRRRTNGPTAIHHRVRARSSGVFLAFATANVSGGHMNPAVTFAAVVNRKISGPRGLMFVSAQLAGAVVGALLLLATIPGAADHKEYAAGRGHSRRAMPAAPPPRLASRSWS